MSSSALARFLATPPRTPGLVGLVGNESGPFNNYLCRNRGGGLVDSLNSKGKIIIVLELNESTSPPPLFLHK